MTRRSLLSGFGAAVGTQAIGVRYVNARAVPRPHKVPRRPRRRSSTSMFPLGGRGISARQISGRRARQIPLLLPPAAEQRRIAEKVKLLLTCVKGAQDRIARVVVAAADERHLNAATSLVGKLMQAILAKAFSGESRVFSRPDRFGLFFARQVHQLPLPRPVSDEDPAVLPWRCRDDVMVHGGLRRAQNERGNAGGQSSTGR